MPNGVTGMITYRLLKKMLGKEAVPLRMTSTYLRGWVILVERIKSGSLWWY
jgi:hypothetical protein